ncbi:unnamed protein product [Urochloa humidicola]
MIQLRDRLPVVTRTGTPCPPVPPPPLARRRPVACTRRSQLPAAPLALPAHGRRCHHGDGGRPLPVAGAWRRLGFQRGDGEHHGKDSVPSGKIRSHQFHLVAAEERHLTGA